MNARAPITAGQLAARQRWTAELYARARDTYEVGRLEWNPAARGGLFAQAMVRQAAAAAAADMSGVRS